jgi:hypothetical protein
MLGRCRKGRLGTAKKHPRPGFATRRYPETGLRVAAISPIMSAIHAPWRDHDQINRRRGVAASVRHLARSARAGHTGEASTADTTAGAGHAKHHGAKTFDDVDRMPLP